MATRYGATSGDLSYRAASAGDAIPGRKPLTITFNFTPVSDNGALAPICIRYGDAGGTSYGGVFLDNTGATTIVKIGGQSSGGYGTGTVVTLGVTYRAAYKRVNDELYLYINDALIEQLSVADTADSSATLAFGGNSGVASSVDIENIKVYEADLSLDEIVRETRVRRPTRAANLWAWYMPVRGRSRTVDWSGNGRTLRELGTLSDVDGGPIPWGASPLLVGRPVSNTLTTGLAAETDSAQTLALLKRVTAGQSSETDSAITRSLVRKLLAGTSTESDTAFAETLTKKVSLNFSAESDSALALGLAVLLPTGRANEADAATSLALTKIISTGLASETDEAVTVPFSGTLAFGAASETDTALALSFVATRPVTQPSGGYDLDTHAHKMRMRLTQPHITPKPAEGAATEHTEPAGPRHGNQEPRGLDAYDVLRFEDRVRSILLGPPPSLSAPPSGIDSIQQAAVYGATSKTLANDDEELFLILQVLEGFTP